MTVMQSKIPSRRALTGTGDCQKRVRTKLLRTSDVGSLFAENGTPAKPPQGQNGGQLSTAVFTAKEGGRSTVKYGCWVRVPTAQNSMHRRSNKLMMRLCGYADE